MLILIHMHLFILDYTNLWHNYLNCDLNYKKIIIYTRILLFRYYFVVQLLLSGIPLDSAVSVVVVSFEPGPHIEFYWPDGNFNPSIPLPPGSSFILSATVSYLTAGCLIAWSTSSETGYSYLTSKHMVNIIARLFKNIFENLFKFLFTVTIL